MTGLVLLIILVSAQSFSSFAQGQAVPQLSPAPDPCGVLVGPEYKLSDISRKDDLVKLSGDWWNTTPERFIALTKMTTPDYTLGVSPIPGEQNFKSLLPTPELRSKKWTPQELPPLEFKFKDHQGLISISGFLKQAGADQLDPNQKLPTGITVSQAAAVRALASRYGKPSRIIGFAIAPGLGATYVWEFDKTILEVSGATFILFSAADLPQNCRRKAQN